MPSAPIDPDLAERMRAAHTHARTALGVQPAPHAREAWGWRGRSLGQPVTTTHGPAWLRLASTAHGHIDHTFWNGSLAAATAIPHTVPRPRLHHTHDWNDHAWHYRAELYDHTLDQPVASSAVATTTTELPSSWWTALRTALEHITAVPTQRHSIDQQYLDWSMPKALGTSINTTAPGWATAHGDLHWANICAPRLQILDWEGWGLAPIGYDAAMLHTHSLILPSFAAQVRNELTHLLDTPTGRFAELVTISELLHNTARGEHIALTEPLQQRATHLLGLKRS